MYMIKLYFISEFIIFISLFAALEYYISNFSLNYLWIIKCFNKLNIYNSLTLFWIVFLLSLFLLSIKLCCYIFNTVMFSNYNYYVVLLFLLNISALSTSFVSLQYWELCYFNVVLKDSVIASILLSTIILHMLHVVIPIVYNSVLFSCFTKFKFCSHFKFLL